MCREIDIADVASEKKLLILTRDTLVRDLLNVTLKLRGFSVAKAANPAEAVAAFGATDFWAVFLDARRAGLWGAAFKEVLQSGGPEVKVIALVEESGQSMLDGTVSRKVDAVLPYPFEETAMLRLLAGLAEKDRSRLEKGEAGT